VLQLKHLELEFGFMLHVIHVSGRRMISQGTDGLSRGDVTTGVLQGQPMLSFAPLHLSATQRSPGLISWCVSWLLPQHSLLPLDPTGWFSLGHGIQDFATNSDGLEVPVLSGSQSTVYLWTPPPAAAFLALEQLSYARLKRPHLAHIVVCPRLMTAYWRKLLHKQSDLVFTLPCGVRPAVWPQDMFEPLLVGVCLPFLLTPPWSRRQTPSVLAVAEQLSAVWSAVPGHECPIL
jgi:hypothetical protein